MDQAEKLFRFLLSASVLCAVWFLLSGKADAFHLGIGAAGSLTVAAALFPWRSRRPGFPVLRFALFVPWELWQVLVSNLRVARLVLSRQPDIAPTFVRRSTSMSDERALTLLGCAVTLTPGTLTVEFHGDEMIVHALDAASADEIRRGVMADRVRKVFPERER